MTKHMICHIEWSSTNLEHTKNFLNGLFDWEIKPFGEDYLLFKPQTGVGGGIMKVDKVKPGESPLIYILVDEIEPYYEKAKKLGGAVVVKKTEIPTVGWYAHLTDPDGNIVGLLEEVKKD